MCHEPQFAPKSLQQDSEGLMGCRETRSPRENNSEVSVEFFSNFAVHRKVTGSYLHWFKVFKSGKFGESRVWENPDEDQSFQRFADPRDFVSRPAEVIAQFLSEILLLHVLGFHSSRPDGVSDAHTPKAAENLFFLESLSESQDS